RKNFKAFVCPSVPTHRLQEFSADPSNHGPGLHSTWIDKRETTTSGLASLPWNEQLLVNLVKAARAIVSEAKDDRFGSLETEEDPSGSLEIDWISLITERLYRIYLAAIKSRPHTVEGQTESAQQIHERLVADYELRIKQNGETNVRHVVRTLLSAGHLFY
ncbi:hypothetical protein F5878DRAFT_545180, partial [Lentinula raphanica]